LDTDFLSGIKVLDFAHMLAGPMAARRLADMGARVIKVEPIGGEAVRKGMPVEDRADEDHIRFHAYNRGKESIEADFNNEEDRALLVRLASEADVLIQSFRPGVLEKFGLGYEDLRVVNPGLVYASFSGFGTEGPWKNDPGQDMQAQARSGLMYLNSQPDGAPMPIGGYPADITGANILAMGIMAGIIRKLRTGQGSRVDSSLLESSMELQLDAIPTYLHRGDKAQPLRGGHGAGNTYINAPYGYYRTADSYIAVSRFPEPQLSAMIQDWPEPEDGPPLQRTVNYETISRIIREKPTTYWLDYIRAAGGWVSEVLDWPKLLAEPHFQGIGIISPPDPDRKARVLLAPLRLNGVRPTCKAAPRLNDAGERIRREGWG